MTKVNKDFLLKATGLRCPHWTTIALWALGILIMTGLTVKDLYPILDDYFDEDENVQVKIETKTVDAAVRPKLHVCVPLPSDKVFSDFSVALWENQTKGTTCSQCEIMADNSFDVWKHCPNITDVESWIDYHQILYPCFMNYLVEKSGSITNDTLNVDNLSWNRPVIQSLIGFLGAVTERENELLQNFGEPGETFRFNLKPLRALHSVLVTLVCELLWTGDFSNSPHNNTCTDMVHAIWYSYSPSADFVCTQLSPSVSTGSLDVYLQQSYFSDYMVDEPARFRIFVEDPAYDSMAPALYSTPSKDLSATKMETVTITYSQQSSVIETRPWKTHTCYNDTSKNECVWSCRAQRLESLCRCRLFFNRKLPTVPQVDERPPFDEDEAYNEYCDREKINSCASQMQDDLAKCEAQCKHPCESVSYQWQVNSDLDTSSGFPPSFSLKMQARPQPYLEFTMKVKDSKQDLISKVGGVFNFYLGLSGLSIIFFLIYILDSGRRLKRLKQAEIDTRDIEADRRPSIGLWRFKWMQLAASVVDMSKESDLQTEILELKNNSIQSEAYQIELVKMVKEMQAREQVMVQAVEEIKLRLAERESSPEDKAPNAAKAFQGIPDPDNTTEKRSRKKAA